MENEYMDMNFSEESGINNSGDFDQLSLAGVDFGADYCENYGITPTNLGGTTMYGGHLDQLGMDYSQMGVIPEGLGSDFNQMGIVPAGLGGQYNQMGNYYTQMGHGYQQLGIVPAGLAGVMDQWNALSSTNKMIAGAAIGVGAYMVLKKLGYIRGFNLPVIG